MRWARRVVTVLLALLAGPLLVAACGSVNIGADWRTADRSPTGIAPDPARTPEAVVQAYAARAFNWRGVFAVHTWLAVKPAGARHFTVHQVVGWRRHHDLPVVVSRVDLPDRSWFGNDPEIVADVRGARAEAIIERLPAAIESYPYHSKYVLFPGPNSNTFIAHLGRELPGLGLRLPTTAIGKDYLANGALVGPAPSNTGYQLSLLGLLGVTAARTEGLEINVLGLNFGVDPLGPAVLLPGVGRVGPERFGDGSG